MLTEVLALSNPAQFGRWERVKVLAGDLARAAKLQNWWEVEVAAMLTLVGVVTLPESTAEKLHEGAPLTASDRSDQRRRWSTVCRSSPAGC